MANFTNHELEVLRPFGPTIAKVKMPQDLIDKLNEYTESVLSDQNKQDELNYCLLYTSPSPRDVEESRMPSSA